MKAYRDKLITLNLGIVTLKTKNFSNMLYHFINEIVVLAAVLFHI